MKNAEAALSDKQTKIEAEATPEPAVDAAGELEPAGVDCGVDDSEGLSSRESLVWEIRSRARFYRLLYKFYRWPLSAEELDAINAEELRELGRCAESELVAEGFNDMWRYLRRRHTGTHEDLNVDFTRCFLGSATYKGFACQPYASLFLKSGGRIMAEPRNRARNVYKTQRIKLAEGVDLPEDHLAFECEFMAVIGERAADALEKGDAEGALEQLELQRKFLEEHILTWSDRFFSLSVELLRTRFYLGLVKVSKGFLDEEPRCIDALMCDIEAIEAA